MIDKKIFTYALTLFWSGNLHYGKCQSENIQTDSFNYSNLCLCWKHLGVSGQGDAGGGVLFQ